MNKPGIKVLHEEDVDYHTNCLTFVDCLKQVKDWSDENLGEKRGRGPVGDRTLCVGLLVRS
jgi:hypothetical protein